MGVEVKRIKLSFVPGLEIEFTDRDKAIKQVIEFGQRGTRTPVVVYGPEGCGKTAWLKQAAEVLNALKFDAIYINVLQREYVVNIDVKEITKELLEIITNAMNYPAIKLAELVIQLAKDLIKRLRKKVAILVDEVFQAIGLERAEAYVKSLLNLIEYPPEPYENIVIIVATSEGFSRWRIGRHRWAEIMPMWNMSRKGFEELYERIPGQKPSFDEVWRLTGGNPYMLAQLYAINWRTTKIIDTLMDEKKLTPGFISKWRKWLELAVEDPDNLWGADVPEELVNELIERNLIVYFLRDRDPEIWVDEPPPEKDPEIGIGRYVAWQTPLHREAVRKVLGGCRYM
jgi:hypothetical protein